MLISPSDEALSEYARIRTREKKIHGRLLREAVVMEGHARIG